MKARYARRIRFAIRMARSAALSIPEWDAHRAADVLFPFESPFCQLEHWAFVRAFRKAVDKQTAER